MKTTFKVFGAIMGLGLVILLCFHFFLLHGLTKTMREVVLPRVKAETGIDARIGRLSLNVPKGRLYLKEIAVRNPDGFLLENLASIDRIQVEVELLSLFKQQPVRIKSVELENALINVIRNQDGEVNVSRLQAALAAPEAPAPVQETVPEAAVEPVEAPAPAAPAEDPQLPEILIEGLFCNIKVRYLDLRLGQFDIALDLGVSGSNISTLRDPVAPWADVAVIGSLGDDRTSFITDLKIALAPLVNPVSPSFDLTGKVMEIDPRILEEAYSRLGIRSAPFGLEPVLHCRDGWFQDSSISLNLRDIQFEEKLADRLGGMASISSLRFPIKVEGSLREPGTDLHAALAAAIGGNSRTLLESFLKGAAAKEAGLEQPPESTSEAAVEVLGTHVEEVGENEAAMEALKDLVSSDTAATNGTSPLSSDVLVEILGEEVEEIGESEELKSELKNLGKWLFGQ